MERTHTHTHSKLVKENSKEGQRNKETEPTVTECC